MSEVSRHAIASFPDLKHLLLEMPEDRTLGTLYARIAERLNEIPDVALARLWLRAPGDLCDTCPLFDDCPDQTECLHLVASAGTPRTESGDWSNLNGRFRRFPIGVRKVGHVAATGGPVEITRIDASSSWIADHDWVRRESIQGFVGQPVTHHGTVLGVLGVFLRVPVIPEASLWLRLVADHAAAAIVNARAFEELSRLHAQLTRDNEYLREEVQSAHDFGEIIGDSPGLRQVLEQVALVAPTDTTALITGESGTGKELIARAIHERSDRSQRPLVKVNCASVPEDLFESEFFGHRKGAFTGAVRDRVGRFELADGGTLFLDEVGEIPLPMQAKLLRVLQDGTFERVGDERTRRTSVRVVAATNRELRREVQGGRFREDLFFRLGVFPIEVIPLRERREDIGLLTRHFLKLHARRTGTRLPRLLDRHVRALGGYDWPGNVRELQNVVERAVIRARHGTLEFDLPVPPTTPERAAATPADSTSSPVLLSNDEVRALERNNMIAVLESTDWKVSGRGGAAEILGVHAATLASRMKAMNIRRPRS